MNKKYYTLIDNYGSETFLYITDNVLVSFIASPDNKDYQEYLDWIAEGNEAEPWDPENPPV